MRSVGEHLNLCLLAAEPLPPLAVPLEDAVDCVLANDIVAGGNMPVETLAGIDGYAVRIEDVTQAPVKLPVTGEMLAGDTPWMRLVDGSAIRVASGAIMPPGSEAVVPLEATDMGVSQVTINVGIAPGKARNVIPRGADVTKGETLLKAGERLDSRKIALLASQGMARVEVHPRVRVVVLAVGDELVDPGAACETGQFNDANSHSLAAACQESGAETFRVIGSDDRSKLRETIEDQLVRADMIITTGGLSYGSADTVKEVLNPLGKVRFDNVAIAPGRQLGVGKLGEVPIYCLPGNPFAAQVSFETFIRPALRKIAGWSNLYRASVPARMSKGWISPLARREFVPVLLSGKPGEYRAEVLGQHSQARLSALGQANAFAVVPEDVNKVLPEQTLHCMVLE